MSIPLDRLYNFLHDHANQHDLIIYRFFPHGSKKLKDLQKLNVSITSVQKQDVKSFADQNIKIVFFHDQEPLNFDLYAHTDSASVITDFVDESYILSGSDLLKKQSNILGQVLPEINLKVVISPGFWLRPAILVHSEKRSLELDRYQMSGPYQSENFIGVYWWCHALIARDWFRYAQHDPTLKKQKTITHDFLIYNRAWSGTREYRLKFIEILLQNNLLKYCLTWFNPVDSDIEYCNYKFKNSNFQIENFDFQNFIDITTATGSASADYCAIDYQCTNIEVVLETLFDDDRLHLTEKILRPIACAQPFILAATAGSLEYLRSYGFETFGDLIDESYDSVLDPVKRLQAICAEMKKISHLSVEQKTQLFNNMKQIALRNQQKFFSDQWQQLILDEFTQNFNLAREKVNQIIKYPV